MANWLENGANLATAISLPTLPWRIIVLFSLVGWFAAVGWKTIRSCLHPEERLSAFNLKLRRLEDFIRDQRGILQVAGLTNQLDIVITR